MCHFFSLKFLIIPASYDALKKYIYQLEKQQAGHVFSDLESGERTSFLNQSDVTETDALFIPLLDRELNKIITFYEYQHQELMEELQDLERDIELQDELGLRGEETWGHYADDDDDDDDSVSRSPVRTRNRSLSQQRKRASSHQAASMLIHYDPIVPSYFSLVRPHTSAERRRHSVVSVDQDMHPNEDSTTVRRRSISMSATLGKITTKLTNFKDWKPASPSAHELTIWTSRSDYAYDIRLLYKRRITNVYISFTNLNSYVEINYSGFRKIIKKYDKVTFSELKDRYLHEVVERSTPFTRASKDKLTEVLNLLTNLYTKCVAQGDRSFAVQQLRLHQRESIAWERDTVWRQMIGRERRGEGDTMDSVGAVLANPPDRAIISIPTPVGRFKITKKYVFRIFSVVVLVTLLNKTVLEEQEANRCLAILSFCTILWATEVSSLMLMQFGVYMRI